MAENSEKQSKTPRGGSAEEESKVIEERENAARPQWLQVFREAFEKARRKEQPAPSRSDLGRDRSRTLVLLVGAAIAVLVLFLVVFSSPESAHKRLMAGAPGAPDLGRRVTPGQQASGQTGSVTPLLSATPQTAATQGDQAITSEDVGRTARPEQPAFGASPTPTTSASNGPKNSERYALARIPFPGAGSPMSSGCAVPRQQPAAPRSIVDVADSKSLGKPSLVFIRSASRQTANAVTQAVPASFNESRVMAELPAGTRLVARLQSAVSTAVQAPVVAAIEYNYERDGEIVVPAGALALGKLAQADPAGDVTIDFNTLQMPDGTTERIDATAMSLNFSPLKGHVSGRGTAKTFLVRSLTGIGTVAAYLVGAGGGTGFNGPLSESSLLRGRIASNIGMAGDQELNSLAFNQRIVVTIPGNTQFFIVLEKGAPVNGAETRPATSVSAARSTPLPTLDELRQLLQLKQEMSEMVQRGSTQNVAAPEPQQ